MYKVVLAVHYLHKIKSDQTTAINQSMVDSGTEYTVKLQTFSTRILPELGTSLQSLLMMIYALGVCNT